MLKFQWNSLRPGDRVAVHDDRDPLSPLNDGVVAFVQSSRGGNDVAVRLAASATRQHEVLRPRRLAVHLMPRDHDEACWRCEAITNLDEVDRLTSAPAT